MRTNPSHSFLRTLAILGLGVIFATPGMAQEAESMSVDAVVTAVESTYKDVTSLKADFVQVTRSAAMGEELRERGQVELKRPGMMRWVFAGVNEKLFVTNGQRMWVWTEAQNQVIITNDVGWGGMTPLLDDLHNLDEHFDVSLVDAGSSRRSYVLELVPKEAGAFKKLRLEVTKKKYMLERVVIVDPFDNEVEISFSAVKLNPDLPDRRFEFTVPAGAQVIQTD